MRWIVVIIVLKVVVVAMEMVEWWGWCDEVVIQCSDSNGDGGGRVGGGSVKIISPLFLSFFNKLVSHVYKKNKKQKSKNTFFWCF